MLYECHKSAGHWRMSYTMTHLILKVSLFHGILLFWLV